MGKLLSVILAAAGICAAVDFRPDGDGFVSRGGLGHWRIDRDAISVSHGARTLSLQFEGGHARMASGELPATDGFRQVRLREVYPGVDVVVYGKGLHIEYDFVVQPGADPSAIRLRWTGASAVESGNAGSVVAVAGDVAIRQSHPVAYQDSPSGRQPVTSRQNTHGNATTFELGSWDRTRTLVIDPVLSLVDPGDKSLERATSSAVDTAGNFYFAGVTRGGLEGSSDFFVTKFSADRKLIYRKRFGGSGAEAGALLAVDTAGNAYLAGTSWSPDFPVLRALQSAPAGDSNAVLVKLDPAGETVYSTYFGEETARSIGVDGAGSAYLLFGQARARVVKLRADGAAIEFDWSGEFASAVMSVEASGNVTLAARASSDFEITPGANASGSLAIFRIAAGRVTRAARAGSGSLPEIPTAIAVGASGSVYLAGEFADAGAGGFALRLDDQFANVTYSTSIGGSLSANPSSITVDRFGIATIFGMTASADLEAVNPLEGSAPAEGGSAFLMRLGAGGTVLVRSYLPSLDSLSSAAADGAGGIWIAGGSAKAAVFARFEPGADGAIELSHSGAIPAGRSAGRFVLRSMNTGSETLGDRAVAMAEPASGIEVAEMTGLGWTCAEGTCRRADPLLPGQEDPVITVLAKVASNVSGVQTLSATLATARDEIAQNSASIDHFRVSYGPDPVIQKVHFGNFSQGQNGATYLIRVTNAGTLPTAGTITVTDTLPQGLTLVSMAGTGWTCSSNTCSRQDALAPDQTYPQIMVTVNVATDAPGSVANTAAVSGGGDADTANNTAIDATIIRGPDLSIVKTHAQNFLPGQQGAAFTIAVSNNGTSPTLGTVTVVDTLPQGLTLVAMSGNGWNCTQAVCTRADALASGASYPAINVSVNVAADAPVLVTNVASVSGGGDTDASNNTSSDPVSVQAGVDLRITKTHVSGNRRGVLISYDLLVTNIGTAPASGTVTVSDTLPSSLTLNSISGSGWTCVQASCSRSNPLAAGASYPPIRIVALSSATAPPSVTNIAAVFADNDIASANNVATATTALQFSDLTITKSHAGNFVRTGKARYTIIVSNNGSAPTVDPTVVTDTLPTGLTLASAAGPGWVCAANVCTSTDPVGPGSSLAPLTVIADIASDAPNSVVNSATVTGTDDTPSNNTANDPTTIADPADLRITKLHNGVRFIRGQLGATYTITVSNVGTTFTTGAVYVDDVLPTGLTLVSMQGSGWACAGSTCTRSDALANSQTYQPITVTVNVATDAPASVINTAVLSGGGDNTIGNNTANDTVTVGTADLTITKTHSGNFFRGQQGAQYDITVTNSGVAPTLGTVTLTDTLPTGFTLFSAIGTGWNCVQATCTRSDVLAPSASFPVLRVRVNVASDAPPQLVNVATVFGGNDPNTANNTAADSTTIDATGTGGPAAPDILDPTAGQVIPTGGVTFRWSAVSNATGYDLRIVETQSSRVIFTGVLAGSASTQTLVSLPNGSFTFRVRSCVGGFGDATCGAFTSQNFTVAATGPTTAPNPLTPTASQVLTNSTITFSWSAVNGATAYELQVVPAAGGTPEMQMRVSAPTTSAVYSSRSGVFDMSVRACTQLCGPWSAARRFSVVLGPVPTTTPEISVSTFGDNSITVSWLPIVGADLFRIVVVQPGAGPGGGALTVASRRVSAGPANFQIPPGAANVLVAACNGDGCGPFATSITITPSAAQPVAPILASPEPGSSQNGPVVLFTWNRVPGDTGSNTWYRLYVQDQSRQSPALDVLTRNNFYAANFKAEGTRYDALVIANPGGGQIQGPAIGFFVRGSSPTAPTAVAPQHQGTVQAGNIQLGWTPVPGATLYEYYVAGPSNPTVRGVTPGLLVQTPLVSVNNQPTTHQMIVRACPQGATCTAGSDAGWGPWSQDVTGAITFTVAP